VTNSRSTKLIGIDGTEIATIETTLVPFAPACDFGTLPHWLDNRRLAYQQHGATRLVVQDFRSGEEEASFDLPEGDIQLVDWSPDNNHGLVYVKSSPDQFEYELWLLSLADHTIELVSRDVRFTWPCEHPFQDTLWGDNEQAAFVSDEGDLLITRTSNGNVISVSMPADGAIAPVTPIRWTLTGEIIWYGMCSSLGRDHKVDPRSDE
jgi:hypothetical protein